MAVVDYLIGMIRKPETSNELHNILFGNKEITFQHPTEYFIITSQEISHSLFDIIIHNNIQKNDIVDVLSSLIDKPRKKSFENNKAKKIKKEYDNLIDDPKLKRLDKYYQYLYEQYPFLHGKEWDTQWEEMVTVDNIAYWLQHFPTPVNQPDTSKFAQLVYNELNKNKDFDYKRFLNELAFLNNLMNWDVQYRDQLYEKVNQLSHKYGKAIYDYFRNNLKELDYLTIISHGGITDIEKIIDIYGIYDRFPLVIPISY